MTITDKLLPILSLLKMKVLPMDMINDKNFRQAWEKYQPSFYKSINILRDPFLQATLSAIPKLVPVLEDCYRNGYPEINEVFIGGTGAGVLHVNCTGSDETMEIFFVMFDAQTCEVIVSAIKNKGEQLKTYSNSKYSDVIPFYKDPMEAFNFNFILKLFKTHAKVETKYIAPGDKVFTPQIRCNNYTKTGFTYLDSKWFTNLVRSDGFKVKGHFRLQPCKNERGEWTREIIWINDFQKEGYTHKAKILNQ